MPALRPFALSILLGLSLTFPLPSLAQPPAREQVQRSLDGLSERKLAEAEHRAVSRSRQDFWARGSPPVTQTWRVGNAATRSRTSSRVRLWPPVKA